MDKIFQVSNIDSYDITMNLKPINNFLKNNPNYKVTQITPLVQNVAGGNYLHYSNVSALVVVSGEGEYVEEL